jgi:glucose/arabinose dehydrogenase
MRIGSRLSVAALVSAVAIAVVLPAPASAQLRSEVVVSGLDLPLDAVPDPLNPGVLYVVEQRGRIRTVNQGAIGSDFLDLSGLVSRGGEQGLLGLAFAPDYQVSRRLYVYFTNLAGETVVSRFLRSAVDPLQADPGSRFDLMWPDGRRVMEQPFSNHNGGHVVFGPDGFLYIGKGDGGSGNDPDHRAQDPTTLLGKMLRIDVNVPAADPRGYRVPPDNPFLDGVPVAALGEIWAFGYRNPWRFAFDDPARGGTGAMFIADVGQGLWEEVNIEPPNAGGRNYGWRLREGAHDFVLTRPPAYLPLTDPVHEYSHAVGRSVTGGFVYRGAGLTANFVGRYFFADFSAGRVWSMAVNRDSATGEFSAADVTEHTQELGGAALGQISSFGQTADGELLILNYSAGRVLKIVRGPVPPPGAPRNFRGTADGTIVTIEWDPPAAGVPPARYRIEAGRARGSADLGSFPGNGATTRLQLTGVPPGTYWARVYGINDGGEGPASNDDDIVVSGGPPGCAPPGAIDDLDEDVSGSSVTLTWTPPDTGAAPVSYIVEVGSTTGGTDLAVVNLQSNQTTAIGVAQSGVYFIRVRAVNACGIAGPASNEVRVVVPPAISRDTRASGFRAGTGLPASARRHGSSSSRRRRRAG